MPTSTRLYEKFGWLIDGMAAHPLGTLIAVNVTQSLARAGIGEAVRMALLRAMGNTAPVPGGGAGRGGGVMGALGVGTAIGLGVGALITEQGESQADAADSAKNAVAKVNAWKLGVRGENEMSPEAAKKMVAEAQGRLDKTGVSEWFMGHGMVAGALGSEEGDREYKQYEKDKALVDDKKLRDAIAAAMVGGIHDAMATNPLAANRNVPTAPPLSGGAK